jgi:hypothetical protein
MQAVPTTRAPRPTLPRCAQVADHRRQRASAVRSHAFRVQCHEELAAFAAQHHEERQTVVHSGSSEAMDSLAVAQPSRLLDRPCTVSSTRAVLSRGTALRVGACPGCSASATNDLNGDAPRQLAPSGSAAVREAATAVPPLPLFAAKFGIGPGEMAVLPTEAQRNGCETTAASEARRGAR